MNCIVCKEQKTTLSIRCTGCNDILHYIYLQTYGATTSAWNKIKPSKIGMEIMNGGCFPFVCKKCIVVTKNR